MKIESKILSELFYSGALTRTELSKRTSFSPSNVSRAVKGLIDEKKLVEVGYKPAERGRKSILLDVNQSFKFSLGIGFSKSVLSVILVTLKGETLGKLSERVESFSEDLAKKLSDEILRDCGLSASELLGVGLCIERDLVSECLLKNSASVFQSEILFEPADPYLSASFAPVNPEELCIFAAAKVVRDKFINS